MILSEGVFDGSVILSEGSDGTLALVNDGTFIGEDLGSGNRTGIQAFLENNLVQHDGCSGRYFSVGGDLSGQPLREYEKTRSGPRYAKADG